MIFVDSGFLVAIFNPADGLHPMAVAWSERISTRLLLTDYILVETMNGVVSRGLRGPALRMIDTVASSVQFQILRGSEGWFDPALDLPRKANDKRWSMTDCTSFAVMKRYSLVYALAHDRHFEEAGFIPLLRHDPSTFRM